ncbi:MAG: hypothetical protein AAF483_00220 [Planctomycetota bacterium]
MLSLQQVKTLVSSGNVEEQEVLALLQTMASEDEELCAWTDDALQQIDSISPHLAGEIAVFCMDRCSSIALWACKLVARVKQQEAESDLLQTSLAIALAQHSSVSVQQSAAAALATFEGLTDQSRHALQSKIDAPDPRLRRLVRRALERRAA